MQYEIIHETGHLSERDHRRAGAEAAEANKKSGTDRGYCIDIELFGGHTAP
jgi:hypothetical protein